jgi:hypothetical protein
MRLKSVFILLFGLLAACGHVEKVGDGESDGDGPCPDGLTPCESGCVDTTADRENCGVCGHFCQNGDHGTGVCDGGACDLDCDDGWWDIDNEVGTGCELPCVLGGNEECNGIDDNCDGIIDNMTADSCPKGETFACTTDCETEGTAVCDNDCRPGDCVPPDEECNGEDEDCDDVLDNGFDCILGAAVACTTTCGTAGTGTCTDDCQIPPPGACQVPDEACNGIDDDCDDEIDEEVFGITAGPVDVTTDEHGSEHPVIAFGETSYLLAWQDDRAANFSELYVMPVLPDGSMPAVDTRLVGNTDKEYLGDIAWDGSNFGLAYSSDNLTADGDFDLWIAVANEDAERLNSGWVAVRNNDQTYPRMVWDGSGWAIVWTDDRVLVSRSNVYFAKVDPATLNIVETSEIPLSGDLNDTSYTDISWSESSYGIVWNQRYVSEEIFFIALNADGTAMMEPDPITIGYRSSFHPSIVWTSSEWVVAWAGYITEDNRGYWLTNLDANGNKITPEVQMSVETSFYEDDTPPVSIVHAPGLGIGAVWQNLLLPSRMDIYFQRFDYDLVPMGEPLRLTFDGFNRSPVIDWDGSGFGIAWIYDDQETSAEFPILRFARVGCM